MRKSLNGFCIRGGWFPDARMQGAFSLWHLYCGKKKRQGEEYLFMWKGRICAFHSLYFSYRPVYRTGTSDQVNMSCGRWFLNPYYMRGWNPVEFGAADIQEHLLRPEQAVRQSGAWREPRSFIWPLPWSVWKRQNPGVCPKRMPVQIPAFGRLRACQLDHLRYSRGLEVWNQNQDYMQELDRPNTDVFLSGMIRYGRVVPWMLDREAIIWDRGGSQYLHAGWLAVRR